MLKGDFDGSNRDYFFQEVNSSDEKTGTEWCPLLFMETAGRTRILTRRHATTSVCR